MSLNPKHLPFLIGLVLALGIYIGDKVSVNSSNTFTRTNTSKQKLNRLIDYLEYEYVDPGEATNACVFGFPSRHGSIAISA